MEKFAFRFITEETFILQAHQTLNYQKMYLIRRKYVPVSPYFSFLFTRSFFTSRPWFTVGKRVDITSKNADASKKCQTKWRYSYPYTEPGYLNLSNIPMPTRGTRVRFPCREIKVHIDVQLVVGTFDFSVPRCSHALRHVHARRKIFGQVCQVEFQYNITTEDMHLGPKICFIWKNKLIRTLKFLDSIPLRYSKRANPLP